MDYKYEKLLNIFNEKSSFKARYILYQQQQIFLLISKKYIVMPTKMPLQRKHFMIIIKSCQTRLTLCPFTDNYNNLEEQLKSK